MAMVEETQPTGPGEAAERAPGPFSPYKPEQGRYARLTAFWSLLFLGAYGAYRLRLGLDGVSGGTGDWMRATLGGDVPVLGWRLSPSLLISVGIFLVFWAWLFWYLNRPKAADLLIETEGELKKVTWPGFGEAVDASLVVIGTVVLLAGFVAAADFFLGRLTNFLLFGQRIYGG